MPLPERRQPLKEGALHNVVGVAEVFEPHRESLSIMVAKRRTDGTTLCLSIDSLPPPFVPRLPQSAASPFRDLVPAMGGCSGTVAVGTGWIPSGFRAGVR
jgi:hypothetical protein